MKELYYQLSGSIDVKVENLRTLTSILSSEPERAAVCAGDPLDHAADAGAPEHLQLPHAPRLRPHALEERQGRGGGCLHGVTPPDNVVILHN